MSTATPSPRPAQNPVAGQAAALRLLDARQDVVELGGPFGSGPGYLLPAVPAPGRLAALRLPDLALLLAAALHKPPEHPRARVLEPAISQRTYPGHPHFYDREIISPLFPPEKTWSWNTHSLVDYLGHVAVWLLKGQVWIATRDSSDRGVWIGQDVSHDPETPLRIVASGDPCHFGSGRKYKQCHREYDVMRLQAARGRTW